MKQQRSWDPAFRLAAFWQRTLCDGCWCWGLKWKQSQSVLLQIGLTHFVTSRSKKGWWRIKQSEWEKVDFWKMWKEVNERGRVIWFGGKLTRKIKLEMIIWRNPIKKTIEIIFYNYIIFKFSIVFHFSFFLPRVRIFERFARKCSLTWQWRPHWQIITSFFNLHPFLLNLARPPDQLTNFPNTNSFA